MDEFDPKYRRIIRESQRLFLQDTAVRLEEIQAAVTRYEDGGLNGTELADAVYKHVHAMKGVALTLYFDTFHAICEELNGKLRHRDREEWTRTETEEMIRLTERLQMGFSECPAKVLPE